MIQPWILKNFSFHPLFAVVVVVAVAVAVKIFVLLAVVIAAAVVVDGRMVYLLVVMAGCGLGEL